MTTEVVFALFLILTVLFLLGVAITGFRARRRLHLTLVGVTFACLATTIVFALRLGKLYDLEAAGWITPVHLTLARICAVAFLLPIVTGLWTIRRPEKRAYHRRVAYLVLILTIASAVTGTWMILRATPLEPSAASQLPD
jgi:hypothetical protein